jgi:Mg/Co/Ni transporter MgtE
MINQFSIELGLTEQQRQQIIPFLKHELPQLAALKKETSLTPVQKVEKLKEISSAVDAKISPLLDPAQQQKFQAIREENRRELIEELGSKTMQKVEGEIKQKM